MNWPGQVIRRPVPGRAETVAGVDVSVRGKTSRAAVVVLSFPDLTLMENVTACRETAFPYVPGLLTFREGPVILDAITSLSRLPDLFIFDGQGLAHPRRLGIASHLGLIIGRPTIGCAKSRLTGSHGELGIEKGSQSPCWWTMGKS